MAEQSNFFHEEMAEHGALAEREISAPRNTGTKLLVSIVVPTYNSEAFVGELVRRLIAVFDASQYRCEIILVNDASRDATWEILKRLKASYSDRVKIVKLLKNSGQHNAILCGLGYVTGDIAVTMDDDLQHPPEEIPKLLEKLAEGYDLVIGSYDDKKHSGYRNLAGALVDATIRYLYRLPTTLQLTSFRAMRRQIVNVARKSQSPFPYITCSLLDQATLVTNVPVQHKEREFGSSSYSLVRSLLLVANLVFSYSSLPIYLTAAFCGVALIAALSTFVWIIAKVAQGSVTVPGWASLIVIVTFFCSLILAGLFVIGIYVARIHHQLAGRKVPFTVDEFYG